MTQVVQLVGAAVDVQYRAPESGTVVLTVTAPDGTTSTPAVSAAGTTYTATLTPTLPGRHQLLWTLDSTTASFADILDVWPTNPRYLVSNADAIDRLQLTRQLAANPSSLDGLPLYIASATAVVEGVTGPLLPDSKTFKTSGTARKRAVVLPAIGVTVSSVTVDGNALASTAYTVDEAAGIVYSDALTEGDVNIVIAYTVGDAQIPPQARQACLEIIAHMWQVTRQGLRESGATDDVVTTSTGFALPRRAEQLLQSVPRAQGIA